MPEPRPDAPLLFRLQATLTRRAVGSGTLLALGAFLIYAGLTYPLSALIAKIGLPAAGLLVLWLAQRMWVASSVALILTEDELREEGGRRLAALDDVVQVGRGTFAIKPSNGFMLTLRTPGPGTWAPGVWWRIGRRVGVGGVTSRYPGRQLAELIEQQIAARRAGRAAD